MSNTWSEENQLYSECVCTSGSETGSPPTDADHGLGLTGLSGVLLSYKAAGAMTAGGYLRCYVYVIEDDETGTWIRAPELDQIVTALTNETYPAFPVVMSNSRVAFLPDAVGQSGTVILRGERDQ